MKMSDKAVTNLYREAARLASVALATAPGLAERAEIHSLACSLIAGQLVTPKAGNAVDHAGADDTQESMLQDSYEGGSGATGGSY